MKEQDVLGGPVRDFAAVLSVLQAGEGHPALVGLGFDRGWYFDGCHCSHSMWYQRGIIQVPLAAANGNRELQAGCELPERSGRGAPPFPAGRSHHCPRANLNQTVSPLLVERNPRHFCATDGQTRWVDPL